MKKLNIWLKLMSIFVITSVITVLATGCGLFPKEEDMLAPPLVAPTKADYKEITVSKGDIANTITGDGTLVSVSQKELYFKDQGGTLKQIDVKLGDKVSKGDVIAELNTDDLDSKIAQQKISVQSAQLDYNYAQQQLTKAQSAGSDTSQQTYNLSKSALSLQSAQLQLQELQDEKTRSTLVADSAGTVVYIADVNDGSNVSAYQALVRIADPSQLQVRYDGTGIDYFSMGKSVDVTYKDAQYAGTVVADPADLPSGGSGSGSSSSTSGTTSAISYVQIKVNGLPADAVLGDDAEISYTVEEEKNVIVIPLDCLHNNGGSYCVEMLDKNSLKVDRNVQIGMKTSTQVEITSGLTAGEKIVE